MDKLTRLEASKVLTEARRLQMIYKVSDARLGQAIWWCCSEHSTLSEELRHKLSILLEDDRATGYDIFHWQDESEVIPWFYKLYVEQY